MRHENEKDAAQSEDAASKEMAKVKAMTEDEAKEVKINIPDSLKRGDGSGAIEELVYEDPIPAADTPEQDYLLKFCGAPVPLTDAPEPAR